MKLHYTDSGAKLMLEQTICLEIPDGNALFPGIKKLKRRKKNGDLQREIQIGVNGQEETNQFFCEELFSIVLNCGQ